MGGLVKSIGGIFGGGDLPTPAAAPAAPTIGSDAVQRAAEEEARKRANAGRASTVFTGASGQNDTGTGASKILLGAGF